MKERNGEWATGRRGDKERKTEENLIHHREHGGRLITEDLAETL
jgi:hypothetical protein